MNADVEFHIRQNYSWATLPANIKQLLGDSAKEYEKCVVVYSIRNQLRCKGNVVRTVKKDEKRYYEELLAYSREHLMLFPYHLSDVIVKGLRITPFQYYCGVLQDLMEQERSYDSLPNFTAADCLRLLGIGRNQYIDLMNQCRSAKKFFRRRPVRELLPAQPVLDVSIEAWWVLQVGYITEDDIKLVSEAEKRIIDQIIDNGATKAGDLESKAVYSLYRKGLVYLDVPINDDDYIVVPPLEGFVMNRVLGDYFETLLYKIFVSIDEHTSVAELAAVLQIDLQLVKNAVSMYCRLGFAHRKQQELGTDEYHPSWTVGRQEENNGLTVEDPLLIDWNVGLEKLETEPCRLVDLVDEAAETPTSATSASTKKIGFLFDSTLTAFLMMGNLSPGLKSHAVTMFEVGKLSDESLDSFLQELDKVADVGEGEAQRYFDHALTLRSTIAFLRHNRDLCPDMAGSGLGLDLLRCESLQSLDHATCARLLNKNYALLVSMAPLSNEIRPVASCSPPHIGPAIPEVSSIWFKLYLYHKTQSGPPSLLLVKGTRIRRLPKIFQAFDRLLVTTWDHDPSIVPMSNVLLTLNDALTHSAVLVQAYSCASEGHVVDVPFPFGCAEGTLADLSSHWAVKKLGQSVDLVHSCGYVTMLQLSMGTSSPPQDPTVCIQGSPILPSNGFKDETSEEMLAEELDNLEGGEERAWTRAEECAWCLLSCTFGLPLFDAQLNRDISQRIATYNLCHKDNLQALTQSSRKLALHLLTFIAEFQGTKPLVENCADGLSGSVRQADAELPHPVRNLLFCEGQLRSWNGC